MDLWDGQMSLFDSNPQREVADGVVVFDLETQRSFADVGGRTQIHKLGVSIGVAYRYGEDRFYVFTEDQVGDLIDMLAAAPLVVGYNILGFDFEVLRGYQDIDAKDFPCFDLMGDLEDRLGFRPRLDSVASATVDAGKSADGLQALEWWKLGEIDKIIDYCRDDVRVTRDVYSFGVRNRFVRVTRGASGTRVVEVDWKSSAELSATTGVFK